MAPKWKQQEKEGEVDSVRISNDATIVASTLSNGQVNLRSLTTGRISYTLTHSPENFAVTSFRFNPRFPRNFITISSDGLIKEWTKKDPTNTWSTKEEGNDLYALDIHSSGAKFATGGTDAAVRVYDVPTKRLMYTLARKKFDMTSTRGHSDRVYSIKFHPTDSNLLLSGGWDNTVQIWDMRTHESVGCLPGPHICGDSLDVYQNTILACSWRTHDQIQIFDLRTNSEVKTMRWSLAGDDKQCQIYVARFTNDGKHFIAGGSGLNQVKVFSTETFSSVGLPMTFSGGVYGLGVANGVFAVGTGAGEVVLHSFGK